MIGEQSVTRYNAQANKSTTSDNPSSVEDDMTNGAFKFETEEFRQKDAFDGSNNTVLGNPLNNHYFPSSYPNMPKGSFSIP
jgi:hypothetical protein